MQEQNYNYESDHAVFEQVESSPAQEKKDNVESSYKIIFSWGHIPNQYKSIIYATWLNSLRYGNELYGAMLSDTYYAGYSKFIDEIVKQTSVKVRIAVLSDDSDVVLGWSIVENDVLHYVFVKPELRKMGIGSQLVPNDVTKFSQLTRIGTAILNKKAPNHFECFKVNLINKKGKVKNEN